jgi:hypothetical protein
MAGLKPIRLAYTHECGAAILSFKFAGRGLSELEIPATALSRDETK